MGTMEAQPPVRGIRLKMIPPRTPSGRKISTITSQNRAITSRNFCKRPALIETSSNVGEFQETIKLGTIKGRQGKTVSLRREDVGLETPVLKPFAGKLRRRTILSNTSELSIFTPLPSTKIEDEYDAGSEEESDSPDLLVSQPPTPIIFPTGCMLTPNNLPEIPELNFKFPEPISSHDVPGSITHRLRDSTLASKEKATPGTLILEDNRRKLPARSVLTVPTRRLGRSAEHAAVSKTVRFDPAIVFVGPLRTPTLKNCHVEEKSESYGRRSNVTMANKNDKCIGVEELVATLKSWKKNKRTELKDLMQALREIESSSDREEEADQLPKEANGRRATYIDGHNRSSFTSRETSSLNPRVPEFKSSAHSPKYVLNVPPLIRIPLNPRDPASPPRKQLLYSPPRLHDPSNFKPILSPEPKRCPIITTTQKLEAVVQTKHIVEANLSSQVPLPPRKKRLVIDDPNECGRAVNSFDQWFADIQLSAFMKKYPLTGKHRDKVSADRRRTKESIPQMPRVPSAPSQKQSFHGNSRNGENKFQEVTGNNSRFEEFCRRGGIRGNATLAVGANDHASMAGSHAAVIQQRLEYLIMKDKEKKALEKRIGLS